MIPGSQRWDDRQLAGTFDDRADDGTRRAHTEAGLEPLARAVTMRLQELLGYSIHPPFMGQLSASHPRKALEPDAVVPVVAQARAAGARLPE